MPFKRGKTGRKWELEVQTHNPYNAPLKVGLHVAIISEDGQSSEQESIDSWGAKKLDRPNQLPGRRRFGSITVPEGFGRPAAIRISLVDQLVVQDVTYVVQIILTSGPDTLVFPAHSTIHEDQGERIFFEGTARLPSQTPKALQALREKELATLKGEAGPSRPADVPLRPFDRLYKYAKYNDLSGDVTKPENRDANLRPTLGGSSALPYPRRLWTGRPLYKGTDAETKPTTGPVIKVPVVPFDDDFTDDKTISFLGSAITGTLPSVFQALTERLQKKTDFADFEDVYDTFFKVDGSQLPPEGNGTVEPDRKINSVLDDVAVVVGNWPAEDHTPSRMTLVSPKQLVTFNEPLLLQGRKEAWETDQEFARQFLAGQNPLAIRPLTKALPEGSAITAELLEPVIAQGTSSPLAALLDPKDGKPRLFVADYTVYAAKLPVVEGSEVPELKPSKKSGVYHAGRAVMYLSDDGLLLPAAVELASFKRTPGGPPELVAYTPKSPASVWLLAKTIFNSLDSGYHQLMSHFVRTHACCEPYLIALRRTLSEMHPVFKLMLPHFRYTLTINADARALLINAGGVIESGFTPGVDGMALSSILYGKEWTFESQGLIGDLNARGFLSPDGDLLVDDYPYAADGLLIWKALTKYFTTYLGIYYSGPEVIAADTELQAFYSEVKTEGHPDVTVGWPKLETLEDLVGILATMAWTASAHHAAVNFGQYDYSSFMLNRPSYVARAMPVEGTSAYKALAQLAVDTPAAQHEILSYLGGPTVAGKIASVLKLLSSHSPDEQYLSEPMADWLTDANAKAAHAEFVKDLAAAEHTIDARNRDPKLKSRSEAAGGLPYTLLCPTSGEGITSRGIPYSVSI